MKLQINLCALALLLMISFTAMAQSKTKAKAKAKKEVAIQLYSVRDILNKVDNKDGKCDELGENGIYQCGSRQL